MTYASEVFPVPGGPQSNMDRTWSRSTAIRSGRPGPTRCVCPITWSKARGRIRAASGKSRRSITLVTVKEVALAPGAVSNGVSAPKSPA